MYSILITDDNKQILTILCEYARKDGHHADNCFDGRSVLELFGKKTYDMILLDVVMPGMDGFEVLREIRKTSSIPVIMITARGEDFERIMGLDAGADDYIVKPFSPAEVMARIRAVLRRIGQENGEEKGPHLVFDNLMIDLDLFAVEVGDSPVRLTRKETEILWTLASHPNRLFTRDNLLDSLWGQDYYGDARTVDSHIKRLRAKLDGYPHPTWRIKTV